MPLFGPEPSLFRGPLREPRAGVTAYVATERTSGARATRQRCPLNFSATP